LKADRDLGGVEKQDLRLIFLGDVVGRTGRDAVAQHLPSLRERYQPDLVVVNGENAAHGFGITEDIFNGLREAGADVVTLGNHAFDQREALVFIVREDRLIRPINWTSGCPGAGSAMVETAKGQRALVINAMGRVMVEPSLDDPFPAIDRALEETRLGRDCDAILIDFHAEATSEKMAMGHFVDGRASVIVGTHTHSPTADHQILSGGTAYQSDAGMCGDYDSVIGMEKTEPMQRFLRKLPVERMKPAEGEATVCGLAVETDDATGHALKVAPMRVGGRLSQADVPFW
jgi:2',3'-cyclic-nucleotide 2'-phosphodiesterase